MLIQTTGSLLLFSLTFQCLHFYPNIIFWYLNSKEINNTSLTLKHIYDVLIYLKVKLHFDNTNLWLTLGCPAFTLFGI